MHWTSADLESLPIKEGVRYEIIDGELFVSTVPHWHHQYTCGRILVELHLLNERSQAGQAVGGPGVIFSEDNDVIPDVVWISNERLQLDSAGHIHTAPELVIEVLSPGKANERRDREKKLQLYSRRGVQEYWLVDWRLRQVEVYRRSDSALELLAKLGDDDHLETPLLPGFSCDVQTLFERLPG
jgi:Uma2 family endonuclease